MFLLEIEGYNKSLSQLQDNYQLHNYYADDRILHASFQSWQCVPIVEKSWKSFELESNMKGPFQSFATMLEK